MGAGERSVVLLLMQEAGGESGVTWSCLPPLWLKLEVGIEDEM